MGGLSVIPKVSKVNHSHMQYIRSIMACVNSLQFNNSSSDSLLLAI